MRLSVKKGLYKGSCAYGPSHLESTDNLEAMVSISATVPIKVKGETPKNKSIRIIVPISGIYELNHQTEMAIKMHEMYHIKRLGGRIK